MSCKKIGWILLLSAILSLIAIGMGSTIPPDYVTTFNPPTDVNVLNSPITESSTYSPFVTDVVSNSHLSTNTTEENTSSPDCICVRYYLCDDEELLLDYGRKEPLIDLPKNWECESSLDFCCKNVIEHVFEHVIEPSPKPMPTTAPQLLPYLRSCGRRNAALTTNGSAGWDGVVQFGELPWMVALLQTSSEGKSDYLCGGSLIHPQVVMTGAHCVSGKKDLLIRAGEWDTQSTQEVYPTQDRNVTQVIIHEEYVRASLYNDMALLFLESPEEIKADEGHIGLACLPEYEENFDGRDCIASGWGKDKYGKEGYYQTILKKVNLPVVRRDDCEKSLQKTRLGLLFKLHPSFICAGGKADVDTCTGDGGSPLVCPRKQEPGVYVQAGIVAWGIGCGSDDTPAAYVNVAAFVPWINEKIQAHLPL